MAKGKQRTTFAKLNRESKLREKRFEKQMKKDARRRAAAEGTAHPHETPVDQDR